MTPISPSAAIDVLRKRMAVRVYGETATLKLLEIEDKFDARLKWRNQFSKPKVDAELRTIEGVKNEIAKRDSDEIEIAKAEFRARNRIDTYFPDEGPCRRELYVKHMEFVGHTKIDDEIMMLAANKVGKTDLGGYCVSTWATGRYPDWWHGRVVESPVTIWIANKTAKDTRDINESVLLGPPGNEAERGTGMLRGHLLQKCTPKPGTPNAFEFVNVEHVSGGTSYLVSKSYDQGREAFQGRNIFGIWNDEEVPKDVADEERLRIMTTGGLIIYTYTPIMGLTEMTSAFMESAGLNIDDMRQKIEDEEAP